MNTEDQAPVLFEQRVGVDGAVIGIATLNAPRTLNGFSLAMAQLLGEQLQRWARDPAVAEFYLQ